MFKNVKKLTPEQKESFILRVREAWDKTPAFSVHIFTATGAFVAFLSLIAAAEGRFADAFWWLGLALLIDGLDGPLARKLKITEVLPNWSGVMLDNIIDYTTYVLIPAFALYQSGMIDGSMSFFVSGMIVVSSAVYYADTGMKTDQNFFSGFPVVWNMVIFTLFAVNATEAFAISVIFFSVILTFVPLYFLHPVRVVRLRGLNLSVFAIWSILGMMALLSGFQAPVWVKVGLLCSSVYLYFIGIALQALPKLGAKSL